MSTTIQAGTQAVLAAGQFGPRAAAYLTSTPHAQGADLARLAAIAAAHPGARMLDLGCGGGHVAYAVAPGAGQVVAYDLSADMLDVVAAEAARRGLANIVTEAGAAEALPFADASFDCVFSRFSAHHWGDVEAGLREARRVLRPGGVLAFADVVSPGVPVLDTFMQAIELLRDPSHVRDYTAAEWSAMLQRAGLQLSGTIAGRLRLEFASWIARMRTPQVQEAAIRALQAAVAEPVRRYFEVQADGTFTVDTLVIEGRAAA